MGRKKSFKVTPKHRRFIQFYVKTGNASEAGRLSGFTAKYGRDLMQEGAILSAIREAELKAGLSDELLLRTHLDLLTNGDHNIKTQNLRLAYQVKKKIGSDEPPAGGPIPTVIIVRPGATASVKQQRVQADGSSGLSIRRAD